MQLIINGEPHQFNQALSVAQLLAELALDIDKVALERNLEIIPRSGYDTMTLHEGDRLEIVHFIGGG